MKNLIKDTDYKYLIASLFISTIYGFSEIFKSEITVNLHLLLSNDSLYLYFFEDFVCKYH